MDLTACFRERCQPTWTLTAAVGKPLRWKGLAKVSWKAFLVGRVLRRLLGGVAKEGCPELSNLDRLDSHWLLVLGLASPCLWARIEVSAP